MAKPKIALYWCASCGGCEESIVDLAEGVLDVVAAFDIVFWPVAIDAKKSDVLALKDGDIAISFINGAIRSEEQEEMVRLLRKKSTVVIAFGSCSTWGGIPGLMNLYSKNDMMKEAYINSPIVQNPDGIIPGGNSTAEGKYNLHIPNMYEQVLALDQVVKVDYYLPGCAPTNEVVENAIKVILNGKLPPAGTVLSPNKAVCEECRLNSSKPEKLAIKKFKRIVNNPVDPNLCFLAQGFACIGIATRAGCKARCIEANMPCEGCFGPTDNVRDQGAKFLSAVASIIDSDDEKEIESIVNSLDDVAGTCYRFSLPKSILQQRRK